MHKIKTSDLKTRCKKRADESCKRVVGVRRRRRDDTVSDGGGWVRMCKPFLQGDQGGMVVALPAQWLCAPAGWAEPPQCPA